MIDQFIINLFFCVSNVACIALIIFAQSALNIKFRIIHVLFLYENYLFANDNEMRILEMPKKQQEVKSKMQDIFVCTVNGK